MCSRIPLSRATVKDLHSRLPHASQRDDVRLVRRTTVFSDRLVHQGPVAVLCERWGLSPACLSHWQQAFLLHGIDSLIDGHSGGRRPQLSPRQKKRWGELSEAAPLVVGCETAGWPSGLIRVLLWRECGVLDHCQDGGTLLHNWGGAFQKARFVSEHLDTAKRLVGLQDPWPALGRAAKRCPGLILFEDETRFAPWGA